MMLSLNGFIYKWFIDPFLSGAQRRIISALVPGDRVLDIACGTGSLSMAMAGTASEVLGIDLSDDMIRFASETSRKRNMSNVSFNARDASDLSSFNNHDFNIAVTSMAIHQFDAGLAIQILKEMKRIAGKVILMDYNYPFQRGFKRTVIYSIERFAGGDHYRNFRRYNELGGLDYFLSAAKLTVNQELYRSTAFRIVECR